MKYKLIILILLLQIILIVELNATSLSVENRFSEGKESKSELVATLSSKYSLYNDLYATGHIRVRDGEGYNKIDGRVGLEYKVISYLKPYMFYDAPSKNSRIEEQFNSKTFDYKALGVNGDLYKNSKHKVSYSADVRFTDQLYTATRSYVKYGYKINKEMDIYSSIVRRRSSNETKYASNNGTRDYADTSGRIGLKYKF